MRIIAFADIHGAYGQLEQMLRRESHADLVVLAGDLTTNGTADEAETALQRIQAVIHSVLSVAGNMDPLPVDERFAALGISLDGAGRAVGEVGFFGVSGGPLSPLRTPFEIPEEEIARKAELGWNAVRGLRWKVFVPHAPPKDTRLDRTFFGRHVGSSAVREFVEARQPDLLICGHIHESRGIDRLGKTEMVNVGPARKGCYAVIDIDSDVKIRLFP
jgi:Icc-related predicted phosphoesterase